jgi:ABC-type transport system substrate-binding protein
MMARLFTTVLVILFSLSTGAVVTAQESDLSVQVGAGTEIPYEDTLPGGLLSTFTDNVFGSWTRLTASGKYDSELLDVKFADQYKRLILKIKPGSQFNNGRALKASDIEFALRRGFYINSPFFAGFLKCVMGVSESLNKPAANSIAGLQVTGDDTLEMQFTRPCPEIIHSLSLPFFAPRPLEEMQSDLIHFRNLPVGAGPYKVVSLDQEKGSYRLQRVRGHGPQNITLLTSTPAQPADIIFGNFAAPANFRRSISVTPNSTLTLFTSNSHGLFDDTQIRSLFYKVFDRQRLALDPAHKPATGLTLATQVPLLSTIEIDQARKELRTLVLKKYPDGLTIKIPVLMKSFSPAMDRVLTEMKDQLSQVSVQVQFFPRPIKFLDASEAKDYPFWLWWLVIDPLAPSVMLASFGKDSAYTFQRVSDLTVQKQFDAVQTAHSDRDRHEAERQLDTMISQLGYGIPLLQSRNSFVYNPATVASLGTQANLLSVDFTQLKSCATLLSR